MSDCRILVEGKFLLPRYRGNSISHGLWISNPQVASMGEKGLSANLQARIVPSKAGYDYDQEPVLNVVTSKAAKASCHAVTKMLSVHEGMTVNGVISIPLSDTGRKQESKSSAITSMRNGVTPCCALSSSEKVASRMPTWGRTDQEANALGNTKDMQTWSLSYGR